MRVLARGSSLRTGACRELAISGHHLLTTGGWGIALSRRPRYARRMGTLYYGDNLDILRRYLKDETVDLVYLDPPLNSAQNYNALFHEGGEELGS